MDWTLDDISEWFERVYERTLEVAQAVPAQLVEWRPTDSDFTCADVVRHIASTEVMNMARLHSGELHYFGHNPEKYGKTKDEIIAALQQTHAEAQNLLRTAGDSGLQNPIPTNQGKIPGWRVVVGMLEHEVHHRSQLCSYLSQMGLQPPPLYGLYVEELPQ